MHTRRIDRSYANRQSGKPKAAATLINSRESEIYNNCSLKKCILKHGWTSKLLPQQIYFRTRDFKLLLQNACLDNYSVSDFSSNSMPDSNSDSDSDLIPVQLLWIWSFLSFSCCICILLNEPADNFSFPFS